MSATTLNKTRNHFANIFARLNDITNYEVEKSTPLGRETKKSDFINYYANINITHKR